MAVLHEESERVRVRRRWNAPTTAMVTLGSLREVSVRGDAGGVCGRAPRGFLYASVWCDHLLEGDVQHRCDDGLGPHELQVCIMEGDNPAALYRRVGALARR